MRTLLLLLAACNRDPSDTKSLPPPDGSGDDSGEVVGDDTGDTDDTDDTGDTGEHVEPDGDWTEGPDLPACSEQTGSGDLVALSGVYLGIDGAEAGYVVYSRDTGLITCVGPDCDTTDASVVCTRGVISPGLIDVHDHMQYNVLGPWDHSGELYTDRYDWQSDGDYWDFRTAYDEIYDAYQCEIGKWAELRLLVAGSTSAIGASGGSCIDILARNLEEGEEGHGLDSYDLYYGSSNVTTRWDESDADRYSGYLSSGSYGAVINHVAEGVGGSVSDEVDYMFDIGMSGPGYVYVHATDATTEQLAQMAVDGTGIAWSPRSNLDLYAATTEADLAMRLGVPVAIGPDWTWSGSANPARELSCAREYLGTRGSPLTDEQLWAKATTDAARLLGLDGVLGVLTEGAHADIAVYAYEPWPYHAVIEHEPATVRLVTVAGQALYGDSELVDSLASDPDWCEEVTACDTAKTFCVKAGSSGDDSQTYADLQTTLAPALDAVSMPSGLEYAAELFDLWLCEDTRASCDLSLPTTGDEDGDGAADTADVCTGLYDPLQADHDGDGLGDLCDPCPLAAGLDSCEMDPADIDDDGVANDVDLCPYLYDDQTDTDGDGLGDACDDCPIPEDCETTLRQIRDTSDPDHPDAGDTVTVSGLVVTGLRAGYGFFVQDPEQTEYAGIFVYDPSGASPEIGDRVSITGTYTEYYDWSEITGPDVTVTGTAALPDPIEVDDACDIATGGADAERYESMRVVVREVSVSDENPDAPSDYQEFEVAGCLRVDDLICSSDCWADQPALGTAYSSITGVLVYTYSNTKVAPQSLSDVVESGR